MKKTSRFQALNINDNEIVLTLGGKNCEAKFPGRFIEQEFETNGVHLLLVEVDPTALAIVLVGAEGKLLDKKIIGNFYVDSILENIEIVSDSVLQFEFGPLIKIEVKNLDTSTWAIDLNGTPEHA